MGRKSSFLFLISVLVFAGCRHESAWKGYTETDSGLFYKLQAIGDGQKKPAFGDYLELGISYRTEKDSLFMDSYSGSPLGLVILPFNHSSFKGSFEELLPNMREGDSISFIVSAEPLFRQFFHRELPVFCKPGSKVKMEVKLFRILDGKSYQEELKRTEQIIEDRDIEEQRMLKVYLDTCRQHFSPAANGIYYSFLKEGSGKQPGHGDKVIINYKGYFLNGHLFESSYDRGQPLEFTYGDQGQVIRGMEAAISLLKKGAKAKFIIPSQLAYGDEGSSTGIVPPFTTVVYEIELLNLTK